MYAVRRERAPDTELGAASGWNVEGPDDEQPSSSSRAQQELSANVTTGMTEEFEDPTQNWSVLDDVVAEELNNSIKQKLDGLLLVGDTWNICRIDGILQMKHAFHVEILKPLTLKGLPEARSKKYAWKIELCAVDNLVLSLLITSDHNCSKTRTGGTVGIVFEKLGQGLRHLVTEAILESGPSKTCTQMKLDMGSRNLVFHESDWEVIGSIVRGKLTDAETNPYIYRNSSIFPLHSKFYFLLHKFGQDRDLPDDGARNYPNVNLSEVTRILVHIAFDQCAEGKAVLFGDRASLNIGDEPTHQYEVAIIPGVKNFVYANHHERNSIGIECIQQYVRLFHEFHRQGHRLFKETVVTRALAVAYNNKANGGRPKQLSLEESFFLEGSVENLKTGLFEIIHGLHSTIVRTELVWGGKKRNYADEFGSIHGVVTAATNECNEYVRANQMCNGRYMIAHDIHVFQDYLIRVMNPLFKTVEYVRQKVKTALAAKDLMLPGIISETLPAYADFVNLCIAEGFLCHMLRGQVKNFASLSKRLVPRTAYNGRLSVWNPMDPNQISVLAETGTISARSIQFSDCFRNTAEIFGAGNRSATIARLIESFKDWMRTNPTNESLNVALRSLRKLCNEAMDTFLTWVLDVNKAKTLDTRSAVQHMWEKRKQIKRYTVLVGFDWYKKVHEKSIQELPSIRRFVQFINMVNGAVSSRCDGGGFVMGTTESLDRYLTDSPYPLVVHWPDRTVGSVFVPCLFDGVNETLVESYTNAFALVHRRIVRKGKFVRPFIKSILGEINKTPPVGRSGFKLRDIFSAINGYLDDSDHVKTLLAFQTLPENIKTALESANASAERVPPKNRALGELGIETQSLSAVLDEPADQQNGADAENQPARSRTRMYLRRDARRDREREDAARFVEEILNIDQFASPAAEFFVADVEPVDHEGLNEVDEVQQEQDICQVDLDCRFKPFHSPLGPPNVKDSEIPFKTNQGTPRPTFGKNRPIVIPVDTNSLLTPDTEPSDSIGSSSGGFLRSSPDLEGLVGFPCVLPSTVEFEDEHVPREPTVSVTFLGPNRSPPCNHHVVNIPPYLYCSTSSASSTDGPINSSKQLSGSKPTNIRDLGALDISDVARTTSSLTIGKTSCLSQLPDSERDSTCSSVILPPAAGQNLTILAGQNLTIPTGSIRGYGRQISPVPSDATDQGVDTEEQFWNSLVTDGSSSLFVQEPIANQRAVVGFETVAQPRHAAAEMVPPAPQSLLSDAGEDEEIDDLASLAGDLDDCFAGRLWVPKGVDRMQNCNAFDKMPDQEGSSTDGMSAVYSVSSTSTPRSNPAATSNASRFASADQACSVAGPSRRLEPPRATANEEIRSGAESVISSGDEGNRSLVSTSSWVRSEISPGFIYRAAQYPGRFSAHAPSSAAENQNDPCSDSESDPDFLDPMSSRTMAAPVGRFRATPGPAGRIWSQTDIQRHLTDMPDVSPFEVSYTERTPFGGRGVPFLEEETFRIFEFMHRKNLLQYMMGMTVCELMLRAKVTLRNPAAVNNHIKNMVNKKPDELGRRVGREIWQATIKAAEDISARQPKGKMQLSKETVEQILAQMRADGEIPSC